MSRFSQYDTDEERLPDGMTRIGYDADEQVYTFRDSDGSLWESAPGCEYGQLTRAGHAAEPNDDDDAETQAFLMEQYRPKVSWRADLMPLLNFGMLIALSLLGLFWYLHVAARPSSGDHSAPELSCSGDNVVYTIQKDDTCWDIAEERGISVDDVVTLNPKLDCAKLPVSSKICLPELATPV